MENIGIWNNDELYTLYKSQLINYGRTSIPKNHKRQLGRKNLKELEKLGKIS